MIGSSREDNAAEIKAAEARRVMLYRRVLGTKDGIQLLRDLTAEFDYSGSSFSASDNFNSHAAAGRDGEKRVLTHMLHLSTQPSTDEE